MYIKNGEIEFNRHRGSGPREEDMEIILPGPVLDAAAVLRGFDIGFKRHEDRYLGNLDVRLKTSLDGRDKARVRVTAFFGLRDWSDEWDDEYEGKILFAVIAE